MSKWVDILEQKYGMRISEQGDFTIQAWLADQSSPDSGCPLVDAPFILEVENDDNIQP